jgi:predicted HicB family RNase H-like nuclease
MTIKTFKDRQEEHLTFQDIAREQLKQREQERKGPKRLAIDLSEELHQTIRMRALQKNISIKSWILRAIKLQIESEEKYE